MGNFGERLSDAMERNKHVAAWQERFARLKEKMPYRDFCANHGLDQGQLSRWLSGTNGPEWESIKRIEKALKKEGF